jgi:hypothetical protein
MKRWYIHLAYTWNASYTLPGLEPSLGYNFEVFKMCLGRRETRRLRKMGLSENKKYRVEILCNNLSLSKIGCRPKKTANEKVCKKASQSGRRKQLQMDTDIATLSTTFGIVVGCLGLIGLTFPYGLTPKKYQNKRM